MEGTVMPIGQRRYQLSELLKNCDPHQLHGEIDFGSDVGREVLDGIGDLTKGNSMVPSTTFLRRDPAEVTPWAETCGEIRCLIEEKDGAAGEVHQVQIHDAKLHYHARTDEFYYVIDGQGTMTLDGTEIELHKGVVVYVPRGIKHKAVGDLTVLVVCVPRGVMNDVHEVE